MSLDLFYPRRKVSSSRSRAVVESLERRQLLAGDFNAGVALPYQLDFNRAKQGVVDRDGSGTGFTWVQPNRDGTELQTRKMDLRIGMGYLRLYSVGNNWEAENSLVNALTVRYAASSRPWVISARVIGPIPQIDEPGEQGGILFGPDQDNYVKFVVTATNNGVGLQFVDEQKFKTGFRHQLPQTLTNIGSLANVQTLDLYLSGDPGTGTVRALYRVNTGPILQMPNVLTLTGDKRDAFFSPAGFAGVMAAQGAPTNGIDFTFDQFALKRGVLLPESNVAGAASMPSKRHFNDVRGGGGQTVDTSIKNVGNGSLTINSLGISGADASQFSITPSQSLPVTLAPGEGLPIKVTFSAASGTALGVKTAALTANTSANNRTMQLRGLATAGTGGENEPSLQRVLDLYEIPVNVGDANPNNVYIGDPPSTPNDEVLIQQLRKAGGGPVVIQPLAVFGVSSNPALRLGYYEPGTIGNATELFTIPTSQAQTVNLLPNGATSFDPGNAAFGIYSLWPGFTNSDGSYRTIYSEDVFNTFDTNEKRHVRFYPMRNPDGSAVANAYVMAHEEFPGGYDFQDFVGVIYNVQPALAGAEIGTENLIGYPAPDRLAFNRFIEGDPAFPNTTEFDEAKVRVRNSGTATLAISSITVTGPFEILSSTGAQNVAPGQHTDVTVRFTGGSTPGVKTGALTIHSNDADEPAKAVSLAGYNQLRPEDNREADVDVLIQQVFGYQVVFTNAGQSLDTGGQVRATGEEILSPFWFRADTNQPVHVRQLMAFHTQDAPTVFRWHNKGNSNTTDLFSSAGVDAQRFFPRRQGNLSQAAEATFTPGSGAFGFRVDNEWSEPSRNNQEQPGGGYGHHLRFFPFRDTRGQLVPNTYVLIMDYDGINYDFNDNVYLISNIRPETPGASGLRLASVAPASVFAADTSLSTASDVLHDGDADDALVIA